MTNLIKNKFYINNIKNNPYWFFKIYVKRFVYKISKREVPSISLDYFTPKETIDYLVENRNISLSRIGDGEIAVFLGGDIYFQNFSCIYKNEFLKMFEENRDNLLIGIPAYEISSSVKELVDKKYNPSYWNNAKILFKALLSKKKKYGSYNISSAFRSDYDFISRLWKDKEVVIVGGVAKYFKNKQLKYVKKQIIIDSPEENSMDEFKEIYNNTKEAYKSLNNGVVLIGCGPCATILAYWLAKDNIISYDLGHFFDINEGVW